jgi:hypothetical protein
MFCFSGFSVSNTKINGSCSVSLAHNTTTSIICSGLLVSLAQKSSSNTKYSLSLVFLFQNLENKADMFCLSGLSFSRRRQISKDILFFDCLSQKHSPIVHVLFPAPAAQILESLIFSVAPKSSALCHKILEGKVMFCLFGLFFSKRRRMSAYIQISDF